jgi:hypothetical protein
VEFAQRDPIESAHNHVRVASEEAYFYAGPSVRADVRGLPVDEGALSETVARQAEAVRHML